MRKFLIIPVALAVALLPAAFLAQAQAGSKYSVTFKVSKTSITKGEKVKLSGKVSPKAAGRTIKFQALLGEGIDATWKTVRTVKIKSNGTYSKKVTPFVGEVKWRAYKPSGSGHASGKSKSVTIDTYEWLKMANADDTPFFSDYGFEWLGRYGPIDVAGHTVSRYFATSQTAEDTTRWYTQNHCKRVRADVGLWDESDVDAVGQFRIFANSKRIASVRVRYGVMIAVDVKFTPKIDRIKFTGEARVPDAGATTIVASNPRMLCTGTDPDNQPF